MIKIPAVITWNGLKRVKLKKDYFGCYDVTEYRVGKKALRLVTGKDVLRFEKRTNGYWGSRSSDLRITFTDKEPAPGQKRANLSIYLDYEHVDTLISWLQDGKYMPPQTRNITLKLQGQNGS